MCLEEDTCFWAGRVQSLLSCLRLETAASVPNFCFRAGYFSGLISGSRSCGALNHSLSLKHLFLCLSNTAPVPVKLILRQTDVQAGFIDAQEGPWGPPLLSCFHQRLDFC